MKKDEIKALVRSSTSGTKTLPLSDLEVLKSVSNVDLDIDRETNDYFYKIKIDELVDKDFNSDILVKNNWELSLDEEYIFLFI